jgi:hypothetical protein
MDRLKMLHNPLPIDRVAARVVNGKAEHWQPQRCRNEDCFDVQPAVRPFDGLTPRDYFGFRMGALRVLGLAAPGLGGKGRKWVARCDCGLYVFRREAALKNYEARPEITGGACCPRCTAKRKIRGIWD